MATVSPADLLAALGRLPLLVGPGAEELPRLAAAFPAPRDLARELVQRSLLTPFQANQLLTGRGDELVVGPYVLLERIGQGGMGQVFKARHTLMHRLVALKLIRRERLGDPSAVARFHREIRAAAKLSHPNIVIAHDAGQAGDAHYLVMELVEGPDLSKLVRQSGPLPVALACEVARQAAVGLQYAHEQGLVHRDIKPSNLVLAAAPGGAGPGTVKVLDLGLARLVGGDGPAATELTRDGALMGTPAYLAPEQADDARAADARADVYALGSTLYYLLTGRPPLPEGSLTQKLLALQQSEPEPVESLRPEVPAALGAVLRRMMAKRPADRFQTPAEAAAALAPFCAGAAAAVMAPRTGPDAPTESLVGGRAQPGSGWTLSMSGSVTQVPPAPTTATAVPQSAPAGWRSNLPVLLIGGGLGAGCLLLLAAAVLIPAMFLLLRSAPEERPQGEQAARTEPAPHEKKEPEPAPPVQKKATEPAPPEKKPGPAPPRADGKPTLELVSKAGEREKVEAAESSSEARAEGVEQMGRKLRLRGAYGERLALRLGDSMYLLIPWGLVQEATAEGTGHRVRLRDGGSVAGSLLTTVRGRDGKAHDLWAVQSFTVAGEPAKLPPPGKAVWTLTLPAPAGRPLELVSAAMATHTLAFSDSFSAAASFVGGTQKVNLPDLEGLTVTKKFQTMVTMQLPGESGNKRGYMLDMPNGWWWFGGETVNGCVVLVNSHGVSPTFTLKRAS
jgi:serine/threonine-protein kinase